MERAFPSSCQGANQLEMECAASHLRGACTGPATLRCGACGALRYCSRAHQKAHWPEHAAACARLSVQMQRAPELFDLPFAFSPDAAPCSLLHSWNIHGQGLWCAACSCFESPGDSPEWRLSPLSCPCKPPSHPPGALLSWEDYYKWRDLPLHSPAALLLHVPLSLYHAQGFGAPNPNSLVVHYLGPERELDLLPVFGELLALLPSLQIRIEFIGPAVPEARDSETSTFSSFAVCADGGCDCRNFVAEGSVTARLWRGLYHDRCGEMERPDLVFGANAGIAAFPSWKRTVEVIETLGVPALFTDYCEEAAVLAAEMIVSVRRCALEVPVQVNPFRQPVSCRNMDLDVPTFSNGFIFGFQGGLNGT